MLKNTRLWELLTTLSRSFTEHPLASKASPMPALGISCSPEREGFPVIVSMGSSGMWYGLDAACCQNPLFTRIHTYAGACAHVCRGQRTTLGIVHRNIIYPVILLFLLFWFFWDRVSIWAWSLPVEVRCEPGTLVLSYRLLIVLCCLMAHKTFPSN